MGRIQRLPFMLGGFMAVISGMISYVCGSDNRTTYIRMAIVMVIFYIIGLYLRETIKRIQKELKEKQEREEQEEKEAELLMQQQKNGQEKARQAHKLDLVAGDPNEEFTPLDQMSKAISSKLKE